MSLCNQVDTVLVSCFYFFFFKQKTAYEMRISDCSSDVCSSDLIGEKLASIVQRGRGPVLQQEIVAATVVQVCNVCGVRLGKFDRGSRHHHRVLAASTR